MISQKKTAPFHPLSPLPSFHPDPVFSYLFSTHQKQLLIKSHQTLFSERDP